MLGPTARAFGEPMPATYGGKEILVCGRIQEVYPRIETEYLKRHPDPMQMYRDKVDAGMFSDDAERREFMQFCVEQACRIQDAVASDVLNWLGTRAGTVFYGTLTAKWPPSNGEAWQELPFLTEAEVSELFAEELAATIRGRIAKADNYEQMAASAENATILAFHQLVDAASGTDLVGKETGPTSTGKAGPG